MSQVMKSHPCQKYCYFRKNANKSQKIRKNLANIKNEIFGTFPEQVI